MLATLLLIVGDDSLAAIKAPSFRDLGYQGELISQSLPDSSSFKPGESRTVEFVFKNTGTKTWAASGSNLVSAYTVDPNYHVSELASKQWLAPNRPGAIKSKTSPGQTVTLPVIITAPAKPGVYQEDFYLAAENKTWIKGTHFYFILRVAADKKTAGLPNMGSQSRADTTSTAAVSLASSTPPVAPENTASSSLEAAGFWDDAATGTRILAAEPSIRVRLFTTSTPLKWRSDFAYQVLSGTSTLLTVEPQTTVSISYAKGLYYASTPDTTVTSTLPLQLSPIEAQSYWSLPEYERKVAGRTGLNFDTYRGGMIVAYQPKSNDLMVVNELPLEQYMAGVTEASDGVPAEYAKALQVAARSYAWQHIPAPGALRTLFDVYATTVDQLYLGYIAEINQPRIVSATVATSGQLVTYAGAPVVTPYFSRSSGTTRSWSAAWGGTDKPWLVPVAAVHDRGLARLGHGVGMSLRDAMLRAGNDGWSYDQILKYYYTGVTVERWY